MTWINYLQSQIDVFAGGEFWGGYLFAALVFIVVLLVLLFFKLIVVLKMKSVAKKTANDFDDMLVNAVTRIKLPFYIFLSLYLGLIFIELPTWLDKAVDFIILIVFVYYGVKVLQSFVVFVTEKFAAEREGTGGLSMSAIKALGKLIEVGLWFVAIVFIVSNLGYDVTSLVTGLGIGGIAIALAVQSVLSDVFSSFSLYFDQPFKVGDVIKIGEDIGEVRKIGLKSTRLETLQGEELIIPNNELTSARVQNFHKMERRRILFEIGVTYETPKKKLEQIPEYIREIIEKNYKAEVSRIFFKTFGDSALIYEVAYYVPSREYEDYVNLQEGINLAIVAKFEKEKIDMAYPTQTIFVKK